MKIKLNFELRLTLIYLIVGVVWIVLTDFLLEFLVKDSVKWAQFQSIKGIVFVVLSTLVIYLLLRHYARQQQIIKNHLRESREKAEESDRLKSAFLANMSHEIRTPMNGILGFVRLMEESNLDQEKYMLYLDIIKKSSNRLLETINDIIEISKIESKQQILNFSDVDINDSINYLYGFFQNIIEKKELSFVLKNEIANEKVIVYTDKNKLESILINLIKNAIKFTEKGHIEFGCRIKNGLLTFYVKDTGIGIPKERQNAIFERFVQSDLAITKPYEGSGLGLAIVKAYTQMLNGSVWVESGEGKGSTFWFSISAKPAKSGH